MTEEAEFGKLGELKSAKYLKKKGYKIIEMNYKTLIGEIDIIALDNDVLVFVEVKSRRPDSLLPPISAVTLKKRRSLYKTAVKFMKDNEYNCNARFDVIEFVLKKDGKARDIQINHIVNAFAKRDVYEGY